MELLDLTTMGSMCLDGLPSPWMEDCEKLLMEAVFSGSYGCDEALATTIASSDMPSETPYLNSGNPYGQVGSWPLQALKSNEPSSDTSSLQSMVLDNSWAPPANSSTSAHSSDTGSEGLQAAECAAGGSGARVVCRTRARRSQHAEAAAVQQPYADQVQPARPARRPRKPRVRQPAVEQPAQPSYQRPLWAVSVGPTLSGVLRPFETVKGYGVATDSRTLQQLNAVLKTRQQVV